MRIGAHVGIADGFGTAVSSALAIGCESVQIFSKSPQMWAGPPISDEAAAEWKAAIAGSGLAPNAVHHGYLVNLASPKKGALHQSRKTFVDELRRAEKLGVDYLVFHPGAHLGEGREAGLTRIVESLDWAFGETPGLRVRALLENSSGQGTALCSTLEELRSVVSRVHQPERAGVTLDTCHLFANGYDFRTPEGYGTLVDQIQATLGREAVRAFHLNDAKAGLGSHLDRHENIGRGELGTAAFGHLVNDPGWRATPGYLETPLDDDDYSAFARDLATLRSLRAETPAGATKDDDSREGKPSRKRRRGGGS